MFEAMPGAPNKYKVTGTSACSSGCVGELDGLKFTMISGFKMSAILSDDYRSITWSNTVVWARQAECDGTATITLQGPSGECECNGIGRDGGDVFSRFRSTYMAWSAGRPYAHSRNYP